MAAFILTSAATGTLFVLYLWAVAIFLFSSSYLSLPAPWRAIAKGAKRQFTLNKLLSVLSRLMRYTRYVNKTGGGESFMLMRVSKKEKKGILERRETAPLASRILNLCIFHPSFSVMTLKQSVATLDYGVSASCGIAGC